eukprot:1573129-Amphidinium_carterae.1
MDLSRLLVASRLPCISLSVKASSRSYWSSTCLAGLPRHARDLDGNVTLLADSEFTPQENVSRKLCALARSGFDRSILVRCLQALQGLSFTTHLTEKLHASAALVKRHHPEYSSSTTAMRAYLHGFRHSEQSYMWKYATIARASNNVSFVGAKDFFFISEQLVRGKFAVVEMFVLGETNRSVPLATFRLLAGWFFTSMCSH